MASRSIKTETVAEAYLAMLKARGVDYLFANAGTDFASIVEALASAQANGRPVPEAVVVPHEGCAVGMAHGYYYATGRMQAVMVHVNVGTANGIANLINAARDQVPILYAAGRTPWTESGQLGARSGNIHWAQEMFDQGGMLREVVKWDYELRDAQQVEGMVDRAIAVANASPKGPVYLQLPREVLARPKAEARFDEPMRAGITGEPSPDPAAVEAAAEILASAKKPLVIASHAGRSAAAVKALAGLAHAFALPVVEQFPRVVNLPTSHAMHVGFNSAAFVGEADAVLILEADVPWIPDQAGPAESCRIVHIAPDPIYQRYPMRTFPADVAIAASSEVALPALAKALRKAAKGKEAAIDRRRKQIAAQHDKIAAAARDAAQRLNGGRATKMYFSHCISEAMGRDDVAVNEYPLLRAAMSLDRPGSFYGIGPAGALGWGLPAALGVQLGAPDRRVIAALGDGAYMFANPVACHQVGEALGLPVLSVVCNNGIWNAVKMATLGLYKDGAAARANRMPLTSLEPSPRFETVVEASGGHGERIEDPAELPKALRRGLDIVKTERRQVLLNVMCA